MRAYWLTLYNKLTLCLPNCSEWRSFHRVPLLISQQPWINILAHLYDFQMSCMCPVTFVNNPQVCLHWGDQLKCPKTTCHLSAKKTWNSIQWWQIIDSIDLLSIGRIHLDDTHQGRDFYTFLASVPDETNCTIGQVWVKSPQPAPTTLPPCFLFSWGWSWTHEWSSGHGLPSAGFACVQHRAWLHWFLSATGVTLPWITQTPMSWEALFGFLADAILSWVSSEKTARMFNTIFFVSSFNQQWWF